MEELRRDVEGIREVDRLRSTVATAVVDIEANTTRIANVEQTVADMGERFSARLDGVEEEATSQRAEMALMDRLLREVRGKRIGELVEKLKGAACVIFAGLALYAIWDITIKVIGSEEESHPRLADGA